MASPTKIIEQLWERKQGFENDVVQCDFDIAAVQNKLTKLKSERLDGLIDDGIFLAQRATLKAELESLQVLFGLKRQLAAHALDGIEDVTAEIAASKAKKSIAVLNKSFERLDGAAQELIASLLEYDTLRQALYIQTGCRGIDSSCLYSEILAKILLSIREESHASRDRLVGCGWQRLWKNSGSCRLIWCKWQKIKQGCLLELRKPKNWKDQQMNKEVILKKAFELETDLHKLGGNNHDRLLGLIREMRRVAHSWEPVKN